MTVPTVVQVALVNSTGSNIIINKPTGTADGDVMYAQLFQEVNNPTFTPPAGWTPVTANQLTSSDSDTMRIFRKVASGEGASYTFTSSNGSDHQGGIISVRGASTGTPEDVTPTLGSGAATTITNPSITTINADCLLLLFYGESGNNSSRTHPSGTTEQWDQGEGGGGGTATGLATKSAAAIGATGTNAWGTNATASWVAVTIAVRDVAVSGGSGYRPLLSMGVGA